MRRKNRNIVLMIAIPAGIMLIALVAGLGLLWFNTTWRFSATEKQNKATLDAAIQKRDPTLCDQIKGKTPYPNYGATDSYKGYQLIDEVIAKQYCAANAQTGNYYGP